MKRLHIYRNYVAVIIIIASAACAKQGSPSGGPKDTDPPEVIRSTPLNGTTNFTGNSITITFDEYVVLDKIQEKFMISPPVEERPEITTRGKSVIISIDENLRDSTTYTLYFQDAIRDLNEGNILENYQFVFSTGDFIDSLMLDGRVYDAFSLEVPTRMMVMLHSNLSDTAPKTVIPDYISMTDQTGYFTINNLRAGTYRIYALEDLNNNRKYEPSDERFAFLSDTVKVTVESNLPFVADTVRPDPEALPHDIDEHQHLHDTLHHGTQDTLFRLEVPLREPEYAMYAFKAIQERYFLASTARREARLLEYYLSLPPDTLDFIFKAPGLSPDNYFAEWSSKRDSLKIWLRDSSVFNSQIIETIITYPFSDIDSGLVYKTDTIPMRFVQPRGSRGGTTQSKALQMTTNASRTGIPPGRDIIITPNAPIESADFSLFTIYPYNDSTGVLLPFTSDFDPFVPREITIKQDLDEGAEYVMQLLPGALISIYGETNDTTLIRFRVRSMDSYGTFTANLDGYEGSVVVQLLDNNEAIIMEKKATSPGSVVFRFVENGNYRLKVIYDTDENGIWSPGDFSKGLQPEKVSFYPEILDIKSNWDVSQDWDISVSNFKDEKLRAKPPQRR